MGLSSFGACRFGRLWQRAGPARPSLSEMECARLLRPANAFWCGEAAAMWDRAGRAALVGRAPTHHQGRPRHAHAECLAGADGLNARARNGRVCRAFQLRYVVACTAAYSLTPKRLLTSQTALRCTRIVLPEPGAYLLPPQLKVLCQGQSGRLFSFGLNLRDTFSAVRDSGKLAVVCQHVERAGRGDAIKSAHTT